MRLVAAETGMDRPAQARGRRRSIVFGGLEPFVLLVVLLEVEFGNAELHHGQQVFGGRWSE